MILHRDRDFRRAGIGGLARHPADADQASRIGRQVLGDDRDVTAKVDFAKMPEFDLGQVRLEAEEAVAQRFPAELEKELLAQRDPVVGRDRAQADRGAVGQAVMPGERIRVERGGGPGAGPAVERAERIAAVERSMARGARCRQGNHGVRFLLVRIETITRKAFQTRARSNDRVDSASSSRSGLSKFSGSLSPSAG